MIRCLCGCPGQSEDINPMWVSFACGSIYDGSHDQFYRTERCRLIGKKPRPVLALAAIGAAIAAVLIWGLYGVMA